MPGVVMAKGVSKVYKGSMREVKALNEATFDIEKGSFTAIIGKSGSGKSTLLKCIAGLIPFEEGSLVVAGKELAGQNRKERAEFRRTTISLVQQFFCLIEEMSVYDNLMLPFDLNDQKRDEALIDDLMEFLEIADLKEAFPFELSGGQQQRVAIARALARKPGLILADEPTGNLDHDSARQVFELLKKAQQTYQQTIVFATHDIDLAKQADHILMVEDGRVQAYE